MKLIDYIEKLKSLHPPSDGSIRRELDQSLNETDPYSFSLSLKNYPIEDVELTPISIIENCNVSKFEVFTFRFTSMVKNILQFTIFGENEADSIDIDNDTNEVVQILYTNIGDFELGYIDEFENITPVAKTQEEFLSALYIAAEISSEVLKSPLSFTSIDLIKRIDYSKRCMQAAGG